jgi:hypothetical protein
VADKNYNVVHSVLTKLDSIGTKQAPQGKLSMLKELTESANPANQLLSTDKPNKRKDHTFKGKLVGEETLAAKLKSNFQDYVKALDKDEEIVTEEPETEQDILMQVQEQLNAVIETLEDLSYSSSSRITKVMQSYTIPWLRAWTDDEQQTGSIAELLSRIQSDEFESFERADAEDENLEEMNQVRFESLDTWKARATQLGYALKQGEGRSILAINEDKEQVGLYADKLVGDNGTFIVDATLMEPKAKPIAESKDAYAKFSDILNNRTTVKQHKKSLVETVEPIVESKAVTKDDSTIMLIGEDNATVAEIIGNINEGYVLSVNSKPFGKTFATLAEAKEFTKALDKNLREEE